METIDNLNLRYFKRLYGNNHSNQVIDRWYWNVARRHLCNMGKVYCLDSSGQTQIGGGRFEYPFEYNGQQFTMSVVVSEGVRDDETRFSVYFLHIGEPSISRHCAFIRIYNGSDTGILGKLDGISNCLDKSGEKEGRVIMTGIFEFCSENKTLLGIDNLELSDLSRYHCRDPTTLKPIMGQDKYTIELPVSRFLTGQLPYYMQFGFMPEDPTTEEIIVRNLSKIKRLDTKDYPLLSKFIQWNSGINENVVDLIKENQDMPLTVTLRLIQNMDCLYYKTVYNRLFDDLGLTRLEDDGLNFIISL